MWTRKIMPIAAIFFTLTATALATTETTTFCELPITSTLVEHFLRKWPLVFSTSGVIYDTSESNSEIIVKIKNGDQVLLSCGPNYFKKYFGTEALNATCNADNKSFVVDNTEIKIKDLTCDLRVIEEIIYPVPGCTEEKFTASTFGYVDPLEKVSLVLGEVCYDTAIGRTLWAHVKLGQNAYLQKAEKSLFTTHRHPDGRYKIELFRGLQFDEIYERIRTQLNTKRAPELKMTHFIDESFLQSAQFQAVKRLGWNYFVTFDNLQVLETLKQDIHELGKQQDLDLYVGSHGVNTLHANDKTMNLFLHISGNAEMEGRFPMPELIWTVVRHQNKAIAFGVFNNPDISEDVLTSSAVCKSECEKVTWLTETLKSNVNRKPLICCSYTEFKNTVTELPNLKDITALLN